MEAKIVLLLNATVILLISFATDHWILLKIRQIPPPSSCDVILTRQMTWLCCGNISYALVEQHTSLYRQCNDMTEGYRLNASHSNQLYASSCYWFVGDPSEKWRLLYTNWLIDAFCLICAIIAALCQMTAVFNSLQTGKEHVVFRYLIVTVVFYTTSILITIAIIHMTNTRTPVNEAHAMCYCEVGWSLICACIAVVLTGVASYIFIMEHRCARERQLSFRRRKQFHNAIMSSCREEVAMAIRARMTVL
ncbi:hypothetical protein GCK32_005563 [Trichostrongylus colubriformis]|uniref:Uncharacterized protein n=1 Tax=Trichostrongylus colubriformis TaxID=6319 RepID=A0AAN8GD29_TRICO